MGLHRCRKTKQTQDCLLRFATRGLGRGPPAAKQQPRIVSTHYGVLTMQPPARDDSKISCAQEDAFRLNIDRIYWRNKPSAKNTASLIQNAQRSGGRGVSNLAGVGTSGRHPQHYQRDLTRKLTKNVQAPPPYYAQIPIKDRKTGKLALAWLPFLLVHGMLNVILRNAGNEMRNEFGFEPNSGFDMQCSASQRQFQIPTDAKLVSFGVGD